MPNTTKREKCSERFSFRISARKNELIRSAAQLKNMSASQYAAESAAKQAEIDLADRRYFTLSEEKMQAFLRALDRPVQEKTRLHQLFTEKTILDKDSE